MNDNDTHLEAHVEVDNISVREITEIQKQLEDKLHSKYEINQTTFQ